MTPGRELDALVAEKVMGRKWPDNCCPWCGWGLTKKIEDGCVVGNCSMRPLPTVKASDPPPYSTSIADAWLVVEKLQCQGHDGKWFFRLDYDCVGTWDCAFYKESTCDGGYPGQWATALTAPHAICLAALKAVGVEEP